MCPDPFLIIPSRTAPMQLTTPYKEKTQMKQIRSFINNARFYITILCKLVEFPLIKQREKQ